MPQYLSKLYHRVVIEYINTAVHVYGKKSTKDIEKYTNIRSYIDSFH